MRVHQIQAAVDSLAPEEQKRLTSWMITQYPVLAVENLMDRAQRLVEAGEWHPVPPTQDNVLAGAIQSHASRTAEQLRLGETR